METQNSFDAYRMPDAMWEKIRLLLPDYETCLLGGRRLSSPGSTNPVTVSTTGFVTGLVALGAVVRMSVPRASSAARRLALSQLPHRHALEQRDLFVDV